MNAARTAVGFFALLGVAQKSCYQHRVDDADDTERNYKNGHQRDKVDFSDKSQVFRIDGETEIKVGALRLIGFETRIGSRSFVLDWHIIHFLDGYKNTRVGHRHGPAGENDQFTSQIGWTPSLAGVGRQQGPPPFHCHGQHAGNTFYRNNNDNR
jgi:hypothetical protein